MYGAEACAHERGEQAAAIGHTRAQHDREHEPQRRERGKGARGLSNEQLQRLFRQQARHAQRFAGHRIQSRPPRSGANRGHGHQDRDHADEDQSRIGQSVAQPLHAIQKAIALLQRLRPYADLRGEHRKDDASRNGQRLRPAARQLRITSRGPRRVPGVRAKGGAIIRAGATKGGLLLINGEGASTVTRQLDSHMPTARY